MSNEKERWLPITGFDGWYDISDWGRVRSWRVYSNSRRRRSTPKILKADITDDGYSMFRLYKPEGERVARRAHVLVAEAFIGPRPAGLDEVAHWDGDPQNNHVSNLRYATTSANLLDKRRHGTDHGGDRNPNARLTNAQAAEIRLLAAAGARHGEIARRYGVSRPTVSRIVRGESFRMVHSA